MLAPFPNPHTDSTCTEAFKQGSLGSHLLRVTVRVRCFAPEASAVMKGRLMSVWADEDSSHLAFSAASLSRCTASLSPVRSMPCTRKNDSRECHHDSTAPPNGCTAIWLPARSMPCAGPGDLQMMSPQLHELMERALKNSYRLCNLFPPNQWHYNVVPPTQCLRIHVRSENGP